MTKRELPQVRTKRIVQKLLDNRNWFNQACTKFRGCHFGITGVRCLRVWGEDRGAV